MKKHYVDTHGRKFRLRQKIITYSALYFYADILDDLRENISAFLDDDTAVIYNSLVTIKTTKK